VTPEPAAPLLGQEAQAVIAEALTAHPAYFARKITAALEPLVAALVAEREKAAVKAEQERLSAALFRERDDFRRSGNDLRARGVRLGLEYAANFVDPEPAS